MGLLYVMIGALIIMIVFTILCIRLSKKINTTSSINIDWCEEEYQPQDDLDASNVTSSVYFGNGLFYTEKEYELYRKDIFNKMDLVIKNNE